MPNESGNYKNLKKEKALCEIMRRTSGVIRTQYLLQNGLPLIPEELGVQLDLCGVCLNYVLNRTGGYELPWS